MPFTPLTDQPNLWIMPAHLDLVAAELELVDKPKREFMLKEALKNLAERVRLHRN
jgi:chromosome partitioning protein